MVRLNVLSIKFAYNFGGKLLKCLTQGLLLSYVSARLGVLKGIRGIFLLGFILNKLDVVRYIVSTVDKLQIFQLSSFYSTNFLKERDLASLGNRIEISKMQPGEITDRLFGTRAYTEGARFQIPRKIPLRIEPKTYFGKHSKHIPHPRPSRKSFLTHNSDNFSLQQTSGPSYHG